MKKNLLAMAAFLSMLAAFACLWFASLQCVIMYQVQTTGQFHGEDYAIPTLIYMGVCSVFCGLAAYLLALAFARLAVRYQRADQHPKSTIRLPQKAEW